MSKDKNGGSEDAREQIEDEQATVKAREQERFEKRWGSGKPKGPEPKGGEGKQR